MSADSTPTNGITDDDMERIRAYLDADPFERRIDLLCPDSDE